MIDRSNPIKVTNGNGSAGCPALTFENSEIMNFALGDGVKFEFAPLTHNLRQNPESGKMAEPNLNNAVRAAMAEEAAERARKDIKWTGCNEPAEWSSGAPPQRLWWRLIGLLLNLFRPAA